MTEQTPNQPTPQVPPQEAPQEPFIPPRYLLILAGLAILVAIVVALTQPTFGVVGYGAVAFGILALLLWALLSPDAARNALTGRTARFGGTSLIVTIILLVALIGVYVVVRNLNLRYDMTQTNTFSLSDESKKAIAALGADPKAPKIMIMAFYGPGQASQRDQDTLLFDDYKKTSNGKIDYEFIDPERQPQTASLYKITSGGEIEVVKLDDKGQPVSTNAQAPLSSSDQQGLTNAILKAASSGVFNAYFLTVTDGIGSQMTTVKDALTTRYGWTVKDVSLLQLAPSTVSTNGTSGTTPGATEVPGAAATETAGAAATETPASTTTTANSSGINLYDPNVTGQVIVIPGGSQPLAPAELKVIQDYVAKGGDLVIMAGTNLNSKQTSLATDDALNNWLYQDFGIKFDKDVVLDPSQAFQSPLVPVATSLDSGSFVTSNGIPAQAALVFEVPNSITVASTPPANVTDEAIVHTTSAAYAKTNLTDVLNNKIDKAADDKTGPFVLAATAENTQTHARIVLLGSTSLGSDTYAQFSNIDNLSVAFNSLIWTTNFNDYFTQITVAQPNRPQDQPLFADDQTLRNINFITIIVLPFGVLALGVLVWFNNRERAR